MGFVGEEGLGISGIGVGRVVGNWEEKVVGGGVDEGGVGEDSIKLSVYLSYFNLQGKLGDESFLTMWAKIGAAAGLGDAEDFTTAFRAFFSFALVD